MSKKILDLGCGWAKHPGAIGVDRAPLQTVDVVANLDTFPLPFKDGFFDEIYLNDVIEHIPDTIKLMEEIYRLSAPKARVYIRVINWSSEYNAMDPTHVKLFHEKTFNFFGEYKDRLHYSSARFKVQEVRKGYSARAKKLFRNNIRWLEFASYYLNNVLEDLNFVLVAEKGGDTPNETLVDGSLVSKLACPACLSNKFMPHSQSNAGFHVHKGRWLICNNSCGFKFPIFDGLPFVTQELGLQFAKIAINELPDGDIPSAFKRITSEG